MKTRKILILIITTLMCLVGFATACKDDALSNNNPIEEQPTDWTPCQEDWIPIQEASLAGTKWRLVGYYDIEANEPTEAIPLEDRDTVVLVEPYHNIHVTYQKCPECYTLEFYFDSDIAGEGTACDRRKDFYFEIGTQFPGLLTAVKGENVAISDCTVADQFQFALGTTMYHTPEINISRDKLIFFYDYWQISLSKKHFLLYKKVQ